MFERYTEKARRVVFFARYEAAQFGSPYIDTEHLLLGILREEKSLIPRFAQNASNDDVREQIEERIKRSTPRFTSVDLPLSNGGKRVLAYAAEEAERLEHAHIGSEHLFLGLIREKEGLAAQVLAENGIVLDAVRSHFSQPVHPWSPTTSRRRPKLQATVALHGSLWDAEYLRDKVTEHHAYSWHWEQQAWTPVDIAVHRGNGDISFNVSLVEGSKDFDLAKAGWKKDHCAICRWELFESKDDPTHGTGYTNGREWLCTECYEKFWGNPNFFASNYLDIT